MTSAVVTGAGMIGLAAAYRLAGDGHRVTVVEAASRAGSGASSHNAGWITPALSTPVSLPIRAGKDYGFHDRSGSVPLRHAVHLSEAEVAITPPAGDR